MEKYFNIAQFEGNRNSLCKTQQKCPCTNFHHKGFTADNILMNPPIAMKQNFHYFLWAPE